MLKALTGVKDRLLDILLPKFCLGCGREGIYICKDCEIFLSEVVPTSDVGTMSVWEYEGLMEKLIYKIKFDGCYHIIDELVEKALARMNLSLPADTVITFVPMHKKRERRRGFNQSELIARKLSQLLGVAEQPLLEKVKNNRSQVGLGLKEREENVRAAFSLSCVKPGFTQLKNVLLIDDIYTTGATMRECTKVLKRAGVKNVWGFTLARKLSI